MSGSRIQLRVSNQKAYVWDVEDIATLRSNHRICGVLTGTLPHLSQQNVFLGPPLLLLPEEVVFLIEKEVAVLVADRNAHRTPSDDSLTKWRIEREESISQQLALAGAKEAKEAGRAMTEAAVQTRKEREERRAKAQAQADATRDSGLETLLAPGYSSPTISADRPSTPVSVSASYTVTVPTTSHKFDWYVAESGTYTTLADARDAGLWSYPSTAYERARCEVFRDLWEKGYFMGVGIKFGADFLVYPGDPLRYHSHFAATVIESPLSTLHPMEIVAHGRLGTATKKAHLLCGWDDEKKEVSHLSIEWAGFG